MFNQSPLQVAQKPAPGGVKRLAAVQCDVVQMAILRPEFSAQGQTAAYLGGQAAGAAGLWRGLGGAGGRRTSFAAELSKSVISSFSCSNVFESRPPVIGGRSLGGSSAPSIGSTPFGQCSEV